MSLELETLDQLLGGTRSDQLEERGKLGVRVRALLDAGRLELITGFALERLTGMFLVAMSVEILLSGISRYFRTLA